MNQFEAEFWNGFLKVLNAAQFELNGIEEKTESEGIEISKELKKKVGKLHSEEILMFLRQ